MPPRVLWLRKRIGTNISNSMKNICSILFVSLLLCGCSNVNTLPEKTPNEILLLADYESIRCYTRAQVDSSGKFSWTDDDLIGICGYKLTNSRFHHVRDDVSGNAFSGVFDFISDSIRFGYFPYQKDIVIKDDSLYFTIQEKTAFMDKNNMAPMVGFMDGCNSILFKQTGGLLHLSFKGFTDDMEKVIVESMDDSKHCLSGNAAIRIDSGHNQVYNIVSGSYKRVFELSFLNKDTCVYDLFVPLQVGYYSKICVSVTDYHNDTLYSKCMSDLLMDRATLIELPLLDFD